MGRLLFLAIFIAGCASISFAQSTDYNKFEVYGGYSHGRIDPRVPVRISEDQAGNAALSPGAGPFDPEFQLVDFSYPRDGFRGFNTSLTGNISRYVGLKFDLAAHFRHQPNFFFRDIGLDSSVFNFLGGVQIKDNARKARFKPFAHALVGVARKRNKAVSKQVGFFDEIFDLCRFRQDPSCPPLRTDYGFAGAFGGGLDIRVHRRFDIRALQIDYNPTHVFDRTQHNYRIGAGIVIH
jgi:hypothetical protein